jgi:ABC-type bacteriocin/lantibiotic exporter with double-glycine peptidase domain
MASKIEKIAQAINNIDKERIFWLRVSVFVVFVILGIIWQWNSIQLYHVQWITVSLVLSLSVCWWYWTMRLIRLTLSHRKDEVEILGEIVNDIKIIKNNITKVDK